MVLFTMLGAHLPFWPLWLEDWGLSAAEIGFFATIAIFARVPVGIAISFLADRLSDTRGVLIVMALLLALVFSLHYVVSTYWVLLIFSLLTAGLFAAVMPLTESLGQKFAQKNKFSYGKARSWGSIGFLMTNIILGYLIGFTGTQIILIWIVLFCLMIAATALSLPKKEEVPVQKATWQDVYAYLKKPEIFFFLAAVALIQASHGVYYIFGSLHWRYLDYSESTIGILWAIGVLAEIVLLFYFSQKVTSWGAKHAILLGGSIGTIRWVITALDPSLGVLAATQTLHAFSFAITHLGGLLFVSARIPAEIRSTFIAVYASGFSGVLMTANIYASSWAYPLYGGYAYLTAAAFAFVGVLIICFIKEGTKARGTK